PTGTLGMAAIKARTGLDFVTIPYKVSSQIPNAIATGEVAFSFDGLPVYIPMVQAGRVKPLFVAARKRSPIFPDVPTAAEFGLQDFEVPILQGLWAPVATPRPVIAKLEALSRQAVSKTEIKARAQASLGAQVVGSTSEEFRKVFERQLKFWSDAAAFAKY